MSYLSNNQKFVKSMNGLNSITASQADLTYINDVISITGQNNTNLTLNTLGSGDIDLLPSGGDVNITGNLNITGTFGFNGDLNMNGYDILNLDALRGELNNTLHIRALGTANLHLQTAGTNDRLTITDTGIVNILTNKLDMNNNNIDTVNSLIGQSNSTLNVRGAGLTGRVHIQSGGATDRLTIDETGIVKIYSNYLDMSGNDIFNVARIESNLTNLVYGSSTTISEVNGLDNVIIGKNVLNSMGVLTSNNVFIGSEAGDRLTGTVGGHVGIGYRAMRGAVGALPSGSSVAVGNQALVGLTTGQLNTGIGGLAGGSITTGVRNTCLGHSAGRYTTTSSNNVSIGYNSGGTTNRASSNVTLVGSDITFTGNHSNSSAFGYGTIISEPNVVFLGRTTEKTYPVGGLKLPTSGTTIDMSNNNIIGANSIYSTDNTTLVLRGSSTSGQIALQTNNIDRLTIDSAGIVKIVNNNLDMNNNNITNAKQIIATLNDLDLIAIGTNYITFNTNNTLRGYITNAGLFKILTNIECDNNTKTNTLSVTNDMDIGGNILLSTTNLPFTAGELGSKIQTVAVGVNQTLTSNTIANIHTVTLPLGVYLLTYTFRITQTSGNRQNCEVFEKGLSTANNTLINTAGNSLYTTYNKLINTSTQVIGLASGETGFYSYTDSVTTGGGTFYLNVRLTFTGSNWTARMEQFDYIRIG